MGNASLVSASTTCRSGRLVETRFSQREDLVEFEEHMYRIVSSSGNLTMTTSSGITSDNTLSGSLVTPSGRAKGSEMRGRYSPGNIPYFLSGYA